MKVVIANHVVYPFHGPGGQEKNPYRFARELLRQGVEVEVVCSDDGRGQRREVYEGIPFTFLPPRCAQRRLLSPWLLLFSWNMSRYLKRQRFHVLHSFINTGYFYLRSERRQPVVMQPYGAEAIQAPLFGARKGLSQLYYKYLIEKPWHYCYLHVDAVAAETETHRQELADFGISPRRLFLLPQGIDLAQIEQRGKESPIARDKLGIGPEEPVVLTVFRYNPHSGLNYLMEAFPRILEKIPQARLIIVGRCLDPVEVATHQSLRSQASVLGLEDRVTCLTNVPEEELYGYYRIADVFVSPNIRGGPLLISTQEAMAWGLPLVDTNPGPLVREGENGYLVPMRDPGAIAQGVLRILQGGQAKEMGLKSKQIIAEYDMSHVAQLALAQYQKLVDGQR